jgi:hypothetical protein
MVREAGKPASLPRHSRACPENRSSLKEMDSLDRCPIPKLPRSRSRSSDKPWDDGTEGSQHHDTYAVALPAGGQANLNGGGGREFFWQGRAFLWIAWLIVPRLFFIQRGDGEVAEWSKARPC